MFQVSHFSPRVGRRKTNLNMQGARHSERNNHVEPPVRSRVDAAQDDAAEPGPEESDTDEFEDAQLEQGRPATRPAGQQEGVRECKEVEPREAHNEVVQLVPVLPRRRVS